MPGRVIETSPRGAIPDSSFKYTPLQHVRVLFASFVQGLFFGAPRGCYHWEPSLEESDIVITDENPIHIDTVGVRPAITFTRGPIQFFSLGLDDMMSYDFQTENKKKSVLVPGTMTINCCSKNDLESELIAWIIAEHLWLLRHLLMREGFFEIGRQLVTGAPSPAGSIVTGDGAKEWYCTSISCPFQFARTSQFTPLNQIAINNIQMALRTGARSFPQQGIPAEGHEVPRNINLCFPPSFAPNASDAHGATPDPANGEQEVLPIVPHPLNPSQKVVVRTVNRNKPGLRPASMGGRVLPISERCVEESTHLVTDTRTVKV